MPAIDIVIDYEISRSIRCRQLEAMFDVPPANMGHIEWKGDLPIDKEPWTVGLIVGPSGSGKTTLSTKLWGKDHLKPLTWAAPAVIDDFDKSISIEQIAKVCQAVGFNTIPAWLRPFFVLSTGEKFRVEMARRLIEGPELIIMDEFTSVVDRQVAKIGANAVQKYIRKNNKRFIAVTCHYDIEDWLQPDWIFDVSTMQFKPRGSLHQRPQISCEVKRVKWDQWRLFAPYHYLTAELHRAATCFGCFVDGRIVSFCGLLKRPNFNKMGQDIIGVSRYVTLPDWQGIGFGPAMIRLIAQAYKACGWRLRIYPAHPALIHAMEKRGYWRLIKKPGIMSKVNKRNIYMRNCPSMRSASRPGAVFEYCGAAMDDRISAQAFIDGSEYL